MRPAEAEMWGGYRTRLPLQLSERGDSPPAEALTGEETDLDPFFFITASDGAHRFRRYTHMQAT